MQEGLLCVTCDEKVSLQGLGSVLGPDVLLLSHLRMSHNSNLAKLPKSVSVKRHIRLACLVVFKLKPLKFWKM